MSLSASTSSSSSPSPSSPLAHYSPSLSPPPLTQDDYDSIQEQHQQFLSSLCRLSVEEQNTAMATALLSVLQQQHLTNKHCLSLQQQHLRTQQQTSLLCDSLAQLQQRCSTLMREVQELSVHIQHLTTCIQQADNPHAHSNGKEEKQQQEESQLHPPRGAATTATSSSSAVAIVPALSTQPMATMDRDRLDHIDLTDFNTLLHVTQAALDVQTKHKQEQKQQQSQQVHPGLGASKYQSSSFYHVDGKLTAKGKAVVHTLYSLSLQPGRQTLGFDDLQRLAQRIGRVSESGPSSSSSSSSTDADADLWWIWQSYCTTETAGEAELTEADFISIYEGEWNMSEDAIKLGIGNED